MVTSRERPAQGPWSPARSARAVACGQADAGRRVRGAATALGLGFIPITWEDFDIVLGGEALPAAEPLIAALRDPAVPSPVGSLGGYNVPASVRSRCWADQRPGTGPRWRGRQAPLFLPGQAWLT
jgi:putative molybdopterin biosynthesis protein